MPNSHLERAERAIAAIRHQDRLPLEIVEALEEIVGAIRSVGRGTLEGMSPPISPDATHADHLDPAKHILALLGEL